MKILRIPAGTQYLCGDYRVDKLITHKKKFQINEYYFIKKKEAEILEWSDKEVIVARLTGNLFLRFPQ